MSGFKKRQLQIEDALNDITKKVDRRLVVAYGRALREFDNELTSLLKDFDGTYFEPGSFNRVRKIRRAEARYAELEKGLHKKLQEYGEYEIDTITEHLFSTYEESMYRSMFNLQLFSGMGFSFDQPSPFQIDRAVRHEWHGSNFSSRLWNDKRKLMKHLRSELTNGLMSGQAVDTITRNMRAKMNSSIYNTTRLVRTETNRIMNEGTAYAYKEYGVREYQILATLDNATSSICQSQDLKIYKLSAKSVGENFPPFHPNCRTTTMPYIPDIDAEAKRVARDKDGLLIDVPADMSYNEWKGKAVKPTTKKKPATIKKATPKKTPAKKIVPKKVAPKKVEPEDNRKYKTLADLPMKIKDDGNMTAEAKKYMEKYLVDEYNKHPILAEYGDDLILSLKTNNRAYGSYGNGSWDWVKDKDGRWTYFDNSAIPKAKGFKGDSRLMFESRAHRDLASMADKARDNYRASKDWSGKLSRGKSTGHSAHTFVHEMGHFLDSAVSYSDEANFIKFFKQQYGKRTKGYMNAWFKTSRSNDVYKKMAKHYKLKLGEFKSKVYYELSRYASTSTAEFFAEGYARITLVPEKDWTDFDKVFNKYYKEVFNIASK